MKFKVEPYAPKQVCSNDCSLSFWQIETNNLQIKTISNIKEENGKGCQNETKLKQLFQLQVCSNDCSLSALCGAFYVQGRDSKVDHISSKCVTYSYTLYASNNSIYASKIFIYASNIFIC